MKETITISGIEGAVWEIINDLKETVDCYNNQFNTKVKVKVIK